MGLLPILALSAAAGLFVLAKPLRDRVVGGRRAVPADLHGKTVIVTGASPGSLGFETARTLVRWGASVVATTRGGDDAALAALRAGLTSEEAARLSLHPLDLVSAASVDAFVERFHEAHGRRLDVLVNNAGVHLDLLSQWKEPRLTDDGFEIQWRTNYLGTMQLTQRLLPTLQSTGLETGDARVVNVVSMLHARGTNAGLFAPSEPYDSWVAYGLSKLALVHATNELDRRYGDAFHVRAFSLHPGSVFTRVAAKGLAGNRTVERVRDALAPVEAFFLKTPDEGAQTQLHCATAAGLRGARYYRECAEAEPSPEVGDAAVALRLWDETSAWVSSLPHA